MMFFGLGKKGAGRQGRIDGIRRADTDAAVRPVGAVRAVSAAGRAQETVRRGEDRHAGEVKRMRPDEVHLSPEALRRRDAMRDFALLRACHALAGAVCDPCSGDEAKRCGRLLTVWHENMGLEKERSGALMRDFMQGLTGSVGVGNAALRLRREGGNSSLLNDICLEMCVYAVLNKGDLTDAGIRALSEAASALGIAPLRLQHLIRLRRSELSLKRALKQPLAGSVLNAKCGNDRRLAAHLVGYALEVLCLEKPCTLQQAAAATQLTVLRYARVNLERSSVPRALQSLTVKNVAEAVSAYRLLQRFL